MFELLVSDHAMLHATGFAAAVVLTALLIRIFGKRLPRDKGRKFAVEGKLSEGKARGAGIIFVSVYAVITGLFQYQTAESCVYILLVLFAMLTGYLDDASETPWKDYKKAVYDLVISAGIAAVYILENGTKVNFLLFGFEYTLPVWLFAILAVALVWLSINVTNCTDGVDGLSSTIGIVTLGSYALMDGFLGRTGGSAYSSLIFIACLMGYLLFNAHPSTVLMGDGGSRAMGTLIAITALRSGDPFIYLLLALVFIADGGLGLVKLFLARFFKIRIFKNIRFPLHDHVRKNLNWSNTQTVYRFAVVQALLSALVLWMIRR